MSVVFERVSALYRAEPVRAAYLVGVAIVAVLKAAGVVVDEVSTIALVGTVLGVIFAGEATRSKVSPVVLDEPGKDGDDSVHGPVKE